MINPSGIKVWTFCPDILNIISYRNGNEVYNRTAFANAVCSFLFLSQFTRILLGSDSVLARKSELRRVRRERHFMSKKSCKAAESIEDALLRMARVNGNFFSVISS